MATIGLRPKAGSASTGASPLYRARRGLSSDLLILVAWALAGMLATAILARATPSSVLDTPLNTEETYWSGVVNGA